MHSPARKLVLLVLALLAALPAVASAAEPPDQRDPCSKAGRDSCNTTGVGRYRTYEFGPRWFGDYRGAVPGARIPTWCIDLRFWYPGRSFGYVKQPYETLRNRDGDVVDATKLARMNYALQVLGRTRDPERQGAVMLYVHALMGDGAPGEVAPRAVGLGSAYARVSRQAARFAGPYRIETSLAEGRLTVGRRTALTVRVRAASGAMVPGVRVALDVAGAKDAPASVTTSPKGSATLELRPSDVAGDLKVRASVANLPASRPTLYVPTKGRAVRNGQRLVAAATTTASTAVARDVVPAQVTVTTKATPDTILLGQASRDAVQLTGPAAGYRSEVEVRLFGPFRTRDALRCDGTPAATTRYTANLGPSTTPPLTPTTPGYYAYQLVVPTTADAIGTTTMCPDPTEVVKVEVQPRVHTQISAQALNSAGPVQDSVVVEGLAGETAPVSAQLFGPYGRPDAVDCNGTPVWIGGFTATGDGTYLTDPVSLTVPGYYTYVEGIAQSDLVRPAATACNEATETTIVRGHPTVTTQISAAQTTPGAKIHDTAVVSGLGTLVAPVHVELFGPFPSPAAIRCDGTPFWSGDITANGDGSYVTPDVTLGAAGYYTYRESIAGTSAYDGTQTACGEATETTIAKAAPKVTTVVSDAIVAPGSQLRDRIMVSGLGTTPVTISVELFGPFSTRAAISCDGTPLDRSTVQAKGDGELLSEATTVPRAGFYAYRERIAGSTTVTATETVCGEVAETSLAAPIIQTGRGDRATTPVAVTAAATIPASVRLARLGISAPITAVGIDTRAGALDIPKNIDRVGWWRDSAAPGASAGTMLLAGHVDSAKRGAGAFYALKGARRGDRVVVTDDGGAAKTWRVTGIRRVRKDALPQSIFRADGPRRLVLVTCGGPFDQAKGHYRDNIIVTAVPA